MKDDLIQPFANGSGDEVPPDWLLPKLLADIPSAESSPKSEAVVFSSFWFAPCLAVAMSFVVLFWWSVSDRTVRNSPAATDSLFTVSYMKEKDTDPCYLLPPIGTPIRN